MADSVVRLKRPLAPLLAAFFLVPCMVCGVTPEQVQGRIDELAKRIKGSQSGNGAWNYPGRRSGFTALQLLALGHAGLTEEDQAVSRACKFLQRNFPNNDTYGVGLYAAAFEVINPKKYRAEIQKAAKWLIERQARNGTWDYQGENNGDNSVTQFALLGLKAALNAGVAVDQKVLDLSESHFRRTQLGDGGWGYSDQVAQMSPSMIPAGLTALHVAGVKERKSLELEKGPEFIGRYEMDPAVSKGIAAMSRSLGFSNAYLAYGIERVGIFYDRQFLGNVEWYPTGCAAIVRREVAVPKLGRGRGLFGRQVGGTSQNLAFNLLFLAKGDKPQLLTKVRWGATNDWNLRFHDSRNMIRVLSLQFQQKLDWQSATLQDEPARMNRTPIVYISGHKSFALTTTERQNLFDFVETGGTVMIAPNLLQRSFIRDLRTELGTLYAGGKFVKIPAEHEVRGMYHDLWGKELPMRVWRDGCMLRRIFIFEQDFSLDFERESPGQTSRQLLANVARFALREKPLVNRLAEIARPQARQQQSGGRYEDTRGSREGAFTIAQVLYGGEDDIDPQAVNNELGFLRQALKLPTAPKRATVNPSTEKLHLHPLLYMCGHEPFSFDFTARRRLRDHLQRGAVLLANACCGSEEFDQAFRAEMSEMFPGKELVRVPTSSPVYHEPFELVPEPNPGLRRKGVDTEYVWGIRHNERYIVLYSPYDYSCAIETTQDDIEAFTEEFGYRLFTNLVSYGMTY